MGLFEKKQCSMCGKDAGRLLVYTLKDKARLCDDCMSKIYRGFNQGEALFDLDYYKKHYLPYYEKTKELKEIFKTTCYYGGLYIDAEHRLFSIDDMNCYNIVKKNNGKPSDEMPVFEFSKTTMGIIRLDDVKVNEKGLLGPSADGKIKLRLIYSEPILDCEYEIVPNAVLYVEQKKGFLSKTLTYDFPQKLLPIKDVFDELIIQAAKSREC